MALLRAYAGEVDSLGAFPAKHVINTLTMMADDNKMSQAPAIAGLILGRINVAASNCKVPLLFLADSIIKNVGNPYRQLFTAGIVDAFNGAMSKVRCAAGLLGLRAPREIQPRQPPRHQPSSIQSGSRTCVVRRTARTTPPTTPVPSVVVSSFDPSFDLPFDRIYSSCRVVRVGSTSCRVFSSVPSNTTDPLPPPLRALAPDAGVCLLVTALPHSLRTCVNRWVVRIRGDWSIC